MSELERLAAAGDPHAWRDDQYFNSQERRWRREKSLDAVRAILRELREPTEGMIRAGSQPVTRIGGWQAMLDHILSEGNT